MNEGSYWERFMNSGRVEDYLRFKVCEGEKKRQERNEEGEHPDAGFCDSDRVGAKGDTYR